MKSLFFKFLLGILLNIVFIAFVQAACPISGNGINANGTTVSESGCTITTSTVSTPGVLAQAGANVTLSNSLITTTLPGSEGARVLNSLLTLNNVAITTTGNSNGLFVSQGHIVMNGGSITVGGVSAFGMQVVGANALVDLDNTTINVTANSGANATGLFANNIGGAGIINAKNTRVAVSGAAGTGAFATGANTQVNLNNTSIQVSGATSGSGVRANNGGMLNVSNRSTIAT